MKVLTDAVYSAVRDLYDRTKPWGVDFVKFTIDFDDTGRIAEISYTPPIPREHEAVFKGQRANVVVGFKDPRRN
jgi:hypothetical protein